MYHFFLNERFEYFIDKDYEQKALQNHSYMLGGYIVINTNKILTIMCYL